MVFSVSTVLSPCCHWQIKWTTDRKENYRLLRAESALILIRNIFPSRIFPIRLPSVSSRTCLCVDKQRWQSENKGKLWWNKETESRLFEDGYRFIGRIFPIKVRSFLPSCSIYYFVAYTLCTDIHTGFVYNPVYLAPSTYPSYFACLLWGTQTRTHVSSYLLCIVYVQFIYFRNKSENMLAKCYFNKWIFVKIGFQCIYSKCLSVGLTIWSEHCLQFFPSFRL